MRTLGVDVSRWQGDVNWSALAASGVRFAFVKATEGSRFVDPTFARNWPLAHEAGLFRGAYHFGRPGGDAETQAAHFAATVGDLGLRDLPPVLDLEESDGHGAKHVLQWAEAFVRMAESLFGRQVILYTGGFWRFQLGNPDIAFFRQRKLWLAAYTRSPVVPASWQDWTFWQYSDGTHNAPASLPGLVGPVDQNFFQGGEADLAALCEGSRPPSAAPQAGSNPQTWPGIHFIWPKDPPVSGNTVRLFQTRLAVLGFQVAADGVYGPQSRAACLAFQRERGLNQDGIVGPATWDACVRD